MANLNFQQPPRSIGSGSLSGRSNSSFGGTLSSGHVTPTSQMFQQDILGSSNFGQAPQPPQLSPNRNVQLSSSGNGNIGGGSGNGPPQRSIFGPRVFPDRRPMPGGLGGGPMSNMGSFMQSRGGYGGSQSGNLSNFHSVFGGSAGDTGTPPLLDLSEFPTLTNARSSGGAGGGSGGGSGPNDSQTNSLQPPGSKPYVGMVKQPTAEQTEFQMSSEDFPALPGTQHTDGGGSGVGGGNIVAVLNNSVGVGLDGADKGPAGGIGGGMGALEGHVNDHANDKTLVKRGVQTTPDGKVTNIPASMVNNQFGMIGLLTFLRAAEADPNLLSVMGQDLTALGLTLNSPENLYQTFGGPFAEHPLRPQDIDFHVPPEYLVNLSIREKLGQVSLKSYKDDLLFFLFYTNVGDVMQLAAAAELHNREWRYHIEERVWITRAPGTYSHYEKNGTIEHGTFYYFDTQNWRRVLKDFQVDAAKLDKCPNLNALMNLSGQPV